jgi:hypothetical protein
MLKFRVKMKFSLGDKILIKRGSVAPFPIKFERLTPHALNSFLRKNIQFTDIYGRIRSCHKTSVIVYCVLIGVGGIAGQRPETKWAQKTIFTDKSEPVTMPDTRPVMNC